MADNDDRLDPFDADQSGPRRPRRGMPVRLGSTDLEGNLSREDSDNDEGGMIMGPNHPVFRPPQNAPPPHSCPPPGARHDPISPLRPFTGGEPDNDEFMPPGPEGDDSAQQPRIRGIGSGRSSAGRGAFGGAPFFK